MGDYADFVKAIDTLRKADKLLPETDHVFSSGMSAILADFPEDNCYIRLSTKQKAHALICCYFRYVERLCEKNENLRTNVPPRQRAYDYVAWDFIGGNVEAPSPLCNMVIAALKEVQILQHLEPAPFLIELKNS